MVSRKEFEFKRMRDLNILEVYDEIVRTMGFFSLREVLAKVSESPARRFWVSEKRATFVIRRMLKGRNVGVEGKMKKEMYREILKRVKELRAEYNMSIRRAVTEVVQQPAPKFYITPKSLSVILFHARRRSR